MENGLSGPAGADHRARTYAGQYWAAVGDSRSGDFARHRSLPRRAAESLRGIPSRPTTTSQIAHRTLATASAIGIQEVVDREEILTWWQAALGELHAAVHSQYLSRTGPSGGIFA